MKAKLGVFGSGWRAEFFLRAAKALPERFEVSGVITRNEEKAARFAREYGVRCYKTAGELLSTGRPDYMVVSVSKAVCADIALELLEKGLPVLMETPAAADLDALARLHSSLPPKAVIQVAEQYPFQPMHSARLSFLKTGKLGCSAGACLLHARISCHSAAEEISWDTV
jgi:predicted dehydrogenase